MPLSTTKMAVMGVSGALASVAFILLLIGIDGIYGANLDEVATESGTRNPVSYAAFRPDKFTYLYLDCAAAAKVAQEDKYEGAVNPNYISSRPTRRAVDTQCYAMHATLNYLVIITALFLLIATVIVLVALYQGDGAHQLLYTSIYFLAFVSALLVASTWLVAKTTNTFNASMLDCDGFSQAEQTDLNAKGFYCVQNIYGNRQDDAPAVAWLNSIRCVYAGTAFGLFACWSLIGAITHLLSPNKAA